MWGGPLAPRRLATDVETQKRWPDAQGSGARDDYNTHPETDPKIRRLVYRAAMISRVWSTSWLGLLACVGLIAGCSSDPPPAPPGQPINPPQAQEADLLEAMMGGDTAKPSPTAEPALTASATTKPSASASVKPPPPTKSK